MIIFIPISCASIPTPLSSPTKFMSTFFKTIKYNLYGIYILHVSFWAMECGSSIRTYSLKEHHLFLFKHYQLPVVLNRGLKFCVNLSSSASFFYGRVVLEFVILLVVEAVSSFQKYLHVPQSSRHCKHLPQIHWGGISSVKMWHIV